ncbi:uncharacterized protein EDB93DRAFT_317724 [Suillus bovinus]|uniref:uncharacterized protein n=1 Tax=Suillus bovinus TaxID=48563 RepID=UPI001B885C17|nr:uncharacterized protein EDB93DRAFT_317724 [Suillus bovinus]KAG2151027.1 hypothetical protein EDB93DRAFT_317724 [Suillus bovinus]
MSRELPVLRGHCTLLILPVPLKVQRVKLRRWRHQGPILSPPTTIARTSTRLTPPRQTSHIFATVIMMNTTSSDRFLSSNLLLPVSYASIQMLSSIYREFNATRLQFLDWVSRNRLSKTYTRTSVATSWCTCLISHSIKYLSGTSHLSCYSSHRLNFILLFACSCMVLSPSPTVFSRLTAHTHPLVLAAFVVDITIMCCTVQCTQ